MNRPGARIPGGAPSAGQTTPHTRLFRFDPGENIGHEHHGGGAVLDLLGRMHAANAGPAERVYSGFAAGKIKIIQQHAVQHVPVVRINHAGFKRVGKQIRDAFPRFGRR